MENSRIQDTSRELFKEYTEYVTSSRVIPGLDLKPVQRRMIWSLLEIGARFGKGKYIKSSTGVGNCMKLHPHGDASITGALANLVNSPNSLIEGRGNWGGNRGHSPAAPRYTEVRTSALFEELFDDSMFQYGDFSESYDGTSREPICLQTKLPLTPLIGSYGIGIAFTSALPARSIESVKSEVLSILTGVPLKVEYGYGAKLYGNKIIPELSIKKIDKKEYLHISNIPKTATIAILSNSKLLNELISSGQVEIIDKSQLDEVSLSIRAPKFIQDLIVDSCSKSTMENFKFFWKRMRVSGYYQEWINYRSAYIIKRENNLTVKRWKSEIIKCILNSLEKMDIQRSTYKEAVESISTSIYNEYTKNVAQEVSQLVPPLKEIITDVMSKPISSIKKYEYSIPKLVGCSPEASKQIMIDEINSINTSLFNKPTIPTNESVRAKFEGYIQRYVAIRNNNEIIVKYRKTPRLTNFDINQDEDLVFVNSDGTIENKPVSFYGSTILGQENKYVGFTIKGRDTVYLTEKNELIVAKRISAIKDIIRYCSPAKKIKVNNKEYVVKSGMRISNVNQYTVLEA